MYSKIWQKKRPSRISNSCESQKRLICQNNSSSMIKNLSYNKWWPVEISNHNWSTLPNYAFHESDLSPKRGQVPFLEGGWGGGEGAMAWSLSQQVTRKTDHYFSTTPCIIYDYAMRRRGSRNIHSKVWKNLFHAHDLRTHQRGVERQRRGCVW